MRLEFTSEKPIYLQLAESIEDDILKGIFDEDSQIVSTTELSVQLKINPATAGKGINLLVDEGILYKKRGVGMFVSIGAKKLILKKRKENFYQSYILSLIEEAKKLNISKSDIINMIERGNEND
ncbi:MAG: transcriptional regulator, GntR family [Haloplasmataceae bacterium]|jgi:DNA-binding transcriptional regulator YhcF (GntR family)|nr:transcriptional regulator, GntR family [Haloplasmataceae bacterium]